MPSWKKVIVSGSAASLSSLTTSGNISGSSTSTGSFGQLRIVDDIVSTDTVLNYISDNYHVFYDSGDLTTPAVSIVGNNKRLGIGVLNPSNALEVVSGGKTIGMNDGKINFSAGMTLEATNNVIIDFDNANSSTARTFKITHNDAAETLFQIDESGDVEIPVGNISGSATSTGSFGHLQMNGKNLPPIFTTGSSVFIGQGTGLADDGSDNDNVGIGKDALTAMASYGGNVAIGNNPLKLRTRGDDNVAIGTGAGGVDGDDMGDKNVFIGISTGRDINNTNSDGNVMIGNNAGLTSLQSISNVLIGDRAGNTLTNSSRNVAIGVFAGTGDGVTNTTTENGVYLGQYAQTGTTNANGEIVLGTATGKGSNTATIGGDNITDIYLSEDVGATVHTGNVSGSATSTGSFGHLHISDKIGISTTAPKSQLHLFRDDSITHGPAQTAGTGGLLIEQDGTGDAVMEFLTTGVQNYIMGIDNSDGDKLKITPGQLKLGDSTTHFTYESNGRMTLQGTNARLAIGSDTPNMQLDVTGFGQVTDRFRIGKGGSSTPDNTLEVHGSGLITGSLTVEGDIIAQNFIVSSSVTSITYQSLSGSTIFGDTLDDTHQFTGSLDITGSIEMNSLNPSVTLASIPHGGTPVIRFVEGTDFRGGFVKFDGASNVLKIGTHEASDSDASNDIDAITMARGTGIVTIPTSLVSDGNVTAAGYIAGTGTFGSQKANILNNFNSYIGLVLKRTGSGTGDFLRLTDSSENTKFSVEDDGTTNVAGNFLPTADNNSDLGAADKRWANIYSADLQLSNEGTEGNEVDGTTGNWTIQEGEDDLYLLNRKNGKKYKFKLEEVT